MLVVKHVRSAGRPHRVLEGVLQIIFTHCTCCLQFGVTGHQWVSYMAASVALLVHFPTHNLLNGRLVLAIMYKWCG